MASEIEIESHLLYFKLTLARPLERAITVPRAKRELKGVDFDGGHTGSNEVILNRASNSQLTI